MSIVKLTYLYCDGDEKCPLDYCPYDDTPNASHTAADQRRDARVEGWVHRGGKDFCPHCAAALAEAQAPN